MLIDILTRAAMLMGYPLLTNMRSMGDILTRMAMRTGCPSPTEMRNAGGYAR